MRGRRLARHRQLCDVPHAVSAVERRRRRRRLDGSAHRLGLDAAERRGSAAQHDRVISTRARTEVRQPLHDQAYDEFLQLWQPADKDTPIYKEAVAERGKLL